MKKAVMTLYTGIGNPNRVFQGFRSKFEHIAESLIEMKNHLTIITKDRIELDIHQVDYKANPEEINQQIKGMASYFSQVKTDREDLQQSVIQQILHFNCIVGIQLQFDNDQHLTNAIINTIYSVAKELNGFLLYPSMQLIDGEGRLVFSVNGESELKKLIPIVNADILEKGQGGEQDIDRDRADRSITILKKKNIPYILQLRAQVLEIDAKLKDVLSIAQRLTALFAVSLYSEVRLSSDGSREEALSYLDKVDGIYQIREWVSPKERGYIENKEADEQECIQFVWRYECCEVLLWALGHIEELSYPDRICDVPRISQLLIKYDSLEDLVQHSNPRSKEEVLDAFDLTLRYNWACVDARIQHRDTPAGLDAGVVQERHYALSWLIEADNCWDEVETHT
ncbi:hypothetical protein J6TS2_41520 [Heyndrickxia sporothermodurans]|nr:hypothetical protein J6TS2_41520 [Heyndrickxia sporothermodurans]